MRALTALVAAAGAAVITTAGPAATADAPAARPEVVRTWNDLAMAAVRGTNASDAQAARTYAMLNVAVFDAVNALVGSSKQREPALVAPEPGVAGDPTVAAAAAAHDVLVALYPSRAASYDAQLASDVAASPAPGQAKHGLDWGREVAAQVLAARAQDGSSPNVSQAGGSGPGEFTASWSGVQFRSLAPFAIDDPSSYVGSGPAALTSATYTQDFNEVKVIGSATPPDAAKSATFDFWGLAGGTNQPPGAWLQVAEAVTSGLSLEDTARLFALESMAMADTVSPTYETKARYHHWRPTTAIRQAASDGNPDTTADSTWTSRAGSVGSSPENWSGHSSFSWAAATVLAGFFCADEIGFTLDTDSVNTGPRSYASFSEAASEAGRSRVLGGLHFEFSNRDGANAGRAIADEVLTTALLPTGPDAHAGGCAS